MYEGRNNVGMTGKHHSEETKVKWQGRIPWNAGGAHADATKGKIAAKARARWQAWREAGEEVWTPERAAAWHLAYQRARRQTPVGRLLNRLRTTIHQALRRRMRRGTIAHRPQGALSLLDYSGDEFLTHITSRLEACSYACRMCGTSLRERFDIDHVTPLATAKTAAEVIALFALENLDVLCPHCNRHVKRAKLVAVA